MDPVSILIGLASLAYSESKCAGCPKICGTGVWPTVKGYRTPCDCATYCETHLRGWAQRVRSSGGKCPNCGNHHELQ
jgi:hypothetical protein